MVMGDLVREADVVVLGGGPGGYAAAFRAADLGLDTVLVEARGSARRRVPPRRLHPVQGAPRHRGADPRRGRARRERGRRLRPAERRRREAPRLDASASSTVWPRGWPRSPRRAAWTSCRAAGASRATARSACRGTTRRRPRSGSSTPSWPRAPGPRRFPGSTLGPAHLGLDRGARASPRAPARLLVVGGGYIGLELGQRLRRARERGHARGAPGRPPARGRSGPRARRWRAGSGSASSRSCSGRKLTAVREVGKRARGRAGRGGRAAAPRGRSGAGGRGPPSRHGRSRPRAHPRAAGPARLHRGRRPASHRGPARVRGRRRDRRADAGAPGDRRGPGGGRGGRRAPGGLRAPRRSPRSCSRTRRSRGAA